MSYSINSGDFENIFFSNYTNSTEFILFNPVGQTLERIDIFLNVQIVQQCGYDIRGDLQTSVFKFSGIVLCLIFYFSVCAILRNLTAS